MYKILKKKKKKNEKKNSNKIHAFLFQQPNQKGEPLTEDESNLAPSYSINNTLNNYFSKFENQK